MLLYTLGIYVYALAIWLASGFSTKAKQWIVGRKGLRNKVELWARGKTNVSWFHCASLGEYEMAIPLIKLWKQKHPESDILLTFFSPSGYQNYKSNNQVSGVFYLPLDTPRQAKWFVNKVSPNHLFLIKYEFWFHHLKTALKGGTQVYLINGVFRSDQIFFKVYGNWAKRILKKFKGIYVQDEGSVSLLHNHNINGIFHGDTRYDRVVENAEQPFKDSSIETFLAGERALVFGSAWEPEIELLKALVLAKKFDGKVLLFTHNVSEHFILKTQNQLGFCCQLYSKYKPEIPTQVLIVDGIGILKYAYRYGFAAIVGGGFGSGLHNILEPIAYALPVGFGPQTKKFPEARQLAQKGIAKPLSNLSDLVTFIEWADQSKLQVDIRKWLDKNSRVAQKIVIDITQNSALY